MADSLILENKKKVAKRRRPSQGIEAEHAAKKTHEPTAPIPSTAVRADDTGHWPELSEKRGRCRKQWSVEGAMRQVRCPPLLHIDEQLLRPVPPIQLYCVIDIMFLLFNLQ